MEGISGDEKRPYIDETKRLHAAHMKSVVYLMCNSILTPIAMLVVSLLVWSFVFCISEEGFSLVVAMYSWRDWSCWVHGVCDGDAVMKSAIEKASESLELVNTFRIVQCWMYFFLLCPPLLLCHSSFFLAILVIPVWINNFGWRRLNVYFWSSLDCKLTKWSDETCTQNRSIQLATGREEKQKHISILYCVLPTKQCWNEGPIILSNSFVIWWFHPPFQRILIMSENNFIISLLYNDYSSVL